MIRRFRCCAFIAALVPTLATAADLGVNGTTLFRVERQSFPGFASKTLMPLTQYIGIDAINLADGNLSAHLYGWGRFDLADPGTEGGRSEDDLSYAYLRYRLTNANGEVKAGRFFLGDVGTIVPLDGVAVNSDLTRDGLALSLYVGRPTPADNRDNGTYLTGGRLSKRIGGILEAGVSVQREGGISNGPANELKSYRQLLGGDLWLYPVAQVELNGRSLYDTATNGFTEHLYSLTYKPLAYVTLNADYQQTPLKHFFAATSLRRTPFPVDSTERMSVVGTSATVTFSPTVEMVADYRHYSRETRHSSDRYGIELRLPGDATLAGLALHRASAGSLATGSEANHASYSEVRGYWMFRKNRLDGSCDASAVFYDHAMYDTHQSYQFQVSTGYRLKPALRVSSDLTYGSTPLVNNEVKWLVRLNFDYPILTSKGAGN